MSPDRGDSLSRIQPITAPQTRPLRQAVLRPGQPLGRLVYPGDYDAIHLGVRLDGDLIAVASFYPEPIPGATDPAWRIRGMATLPDHRAKGHGRCLVEQGLKRAREIQPGPAWCNARTTAAAYYEKLGFKPRGDIFDIPDIGPHVIMVLEGEPITPDRTVDPPR